MSREKEQIVATIDKVQNVVDFFYQQKDKEAFEKLDVTLDDMTIAIDNLVAYKNEHQSFVFDDSKLCTILKDAVNALESEDEVLMADILQYDFIEYINELLEKME